MIHDAFYAPHNLQGVTDVSTTSHSSRRAGQDWQPARPGIQTSLDIGPFSISDLNTTPRAKGDPAF